MCWDPPYLSCIISLFAGSCGGEAVLVFCAEPKSGRETEFEQRECGAWRILAPGARRCDGTSSSAEDFLPSAEELPAGTQEGHHRDDLRDAPISVD